jgi:hypothetical protein
MATRHSITNILISSNFAYNEPVKPMSGKQRRHRHTDSVDIADADRGKATLGWWALGAFTSSGLLFFVVTKLPGWGTGKVLIAALASVLWFSSIVLAKLAHVDSDFVPRPDPEEPETILHLRD